VEKGMNRRSSEETPQDDDAIAPDAGGRLPWVTPKLVFVEPKLTSHGELAQVTGAFFGAFSPGRADGE